MIKQVTVKNFKTLKEETFELEDTIVLAGPNNAGKTTLLQAIMTWRLALDRWLELKGKSASKKYVSVPITRSNFTVLPLPDFDLLWTGRSTVFNKGDKGEVPGRRRTIEIELTGEEVDPESGREQEWRLAMAFRYQSHEQIYVYPKLDFAKGEVPPPAAKDLAIAHVPCFSGIGIDEARYDPGRQKALIGEGKPGDVLRNLLLEIHETPESGAWNELVKIIQDLFGFTLLPPVYWPESSKNITCEYLTGIPKKGLDGLSRLDLTSAGSGFHQALILFAFFLARPSSLLLLDEPDAHLHVILQRDVYDALKKMADRKKCQLIAATHSEILIDAAAPGRIISFYQRPHRLVARSDRDQVREALKLLNAMDVLLAEQSGMVLYLEGATDYQVLREFAQLLHHPARDFFRRGFFHANQGHSPKVGKDHLFALRAINPEIKGLMILDRDYRDLPEHEVSGQGMTIARWRRYEIENYLMIPEALKRFCGRALVEPSGQLSLLSEIQANQAEEFLRGKVFLPDVFNNPLEDTPFMVTARASKDILPKLFEALSLSLAKADYFKIVSYLRPEEVHPEIIEKLDLIDRLFRNSAGGEVSNV